MSEKLIAVPLNDTKFQIEVEFGNRGGPSDAFTESCVVDTGCPDGLVLPERYTEKLDIFRGKAEKRVGAAIRDKPSMFSIEVGSIGGYPVSENTAVVCSCPNYMSPLIGVQWLKKMIVCIEGGPDNLVMNMLLDGFNS